MIFHRIVVTNLFSYLGEQTYRFASAPEGTVALVVGRNGYGKTSLLNAVKLLFLGTDDKSQRKVGFPPTNLSRSDYILGTPRGWSGIMNRHARERGEQNCSVRVELGDADDVTFTATRSWTINGTRIDEDLRVHRAGENEVAGQAAEERLSDFLPRELVPFFFFDGEEVQFLAEGSDGARTEAMERLLSLSFITGVETQLGEVVKEWRREALPDDIKVEMAREEARLAEVRATMLGLQRERDDKGTNLTEQRDRAETLRKAMERLRVGGAVADTRRLEDDIKALEKSLETELSQLATDLATDAPLLANPGLVKAAAAPLGKVIDFKAEAVTSVADTLAKVLPHRLFVEPPQPRAPLSDDQRRFFEDKLHRILDSYAVTDEAAPPFLASLDLGRARDLQQRFLGWNAAMATQRQDRARRLREASAKRAQLERMRAEHREMQYGSGERAEEYRRLEEEFAAVSRDIGKLESELAHLRKRLDAKVGEEKEIATRLGSLDRRHSKASQASDRLRIAINLRNTFELYRKKNRAARRQQIEEAVNRHFRALMSGHHMIDRIAIDDDFVMQFVDADGAEFGQLTISHGMRQLAVTALLWALKEVSGRLLPIIVDTPLARIDRDNQHNLLHHYYPHAAEQVIILATDSEVNAEKFELLRPHLGAQFRLENPDGQSTHVVRTATDRLATLAEALDG